MAILIATVRVWWGMFDGSSSNQCLPAGRWQRWHSEINFPLTNQESKVVGSEVAGRTFFKHDKAPQIPEVYRMGGGFGPQRATKLDICLVCTSLIGGTVPLKSPTTYVKYTHSQNISGWNTTGFQKRHKNPRVFFVSHPTGPAAFTPSIHPSITQQVGSWAKNLSRLGSLLLRLLKPGRLWLGEIFVVRNRVRWVRQGISWKKKA